MQCQKLKTYMETGRVMFLPARAIRPNPAQPRKVFREEALSVPAKKIPVGMRLLGKVGQAPELALILGDEPCGTRAGGEFES